MSGTVKPPAENKRSYRSERRTQQAADTRRAIRDAARRLFSEQGYGATTIAAIADAAGVAPETVYATFKNKRTLLFAIEDEAIVGDDAPIALFEREFVDEARAASDQRERLRIVVRGGLEAAARTGDIGEILRSAAAADPEVAAIWSERMGQRIKDTRRMTEIVAAGGPLRRDFEEAVDLAWALTGPEFYQLLVVGRGWTAERYIEVVTDLIADMALPTDDRPGSR